jgi:YVTN family beta-propeller protein
MSFGRHLHTATVLSDGRVLVVGGFDASGNSRREVQIFNPRTDSWDSAPAMAYPRAYQSATLLADGRVLVAGGYTPNSDPYEVYTRTAEIFDPSGDSGNGTWTVVSDPNPPHTPRLMNYHRVAHVAERLLDGRVLIAGGANYAKYEETAEIFNPANNTFSTVARMSTQRYAAAGALLASGRVLMAGGAYFSFQATAEIYDVATNTWAMVGQMGTPRGFFTATSLADGTVLVAGGWNGAQASNRSQVYDPSTSTWSAESQISRGRYAHAAVLLQDGRLLITGGSDGANALAAVEIWGPSPDLDSSAPVITTTVNGTLGSQGWYQSDVAVSWRVSDLESPVTETSGCGLSTITSDTVGVTFTCMATSGGGTTSSSVTIKRDVTASTIAITQPAAGALFGLGQVVTADYACTDATSGISACTGNVAHAAALDTGTLGDHAFTLTATDAAGNTTNQTVSYTVLEAAIVAPAYVYVPNRVSQTVSVVDTLTNRTVATIPVGPNPINVAVSRDGARAYVANLNTNYVSVIDTATNTNVGSLSVGNGPWGLAISPDGARLFVANLFSRTVTAVDVGSGQTVASVNVAGNARGMALTLDGRYLFVADATEGLVEVIDTTGMTITALIPVGYQPQQAAMTPDGTRVYVPTLNTIAVIDTGRIQACPPPADPCSQAILTQLARTASVPPSGQPVTIVPLPDVPATIGFTADGTRAYIAHSTPGGVMSVLDTASHTLTAVIGLNNYPYGVGVAANGPRVYVGQGGGDTLYVVDTTTTTVMTHATVGSQPALMAITPIPVTLTAESVSGTYGGQIDLTATLTFDGNPVAGRRVSFFLRGTAVGSAVTLSDGTARLPDVALGPIVAGSFLDDIQARFNGDGYYLAANATGTLTVSRATPVITWPRRLRSFTAHCCWQS